MPDDPETYSDAAQVLESLARIGELPTSCDGPGCKHWFRGSLREERLTLLIQPGDGNSAYALTRCPPSFEALYDKPLKVEDTREDQIWRLRRKRLTQAEIAQEMGISQQTISRVLREIQSRRKSKSIAIN